MSRKAIQKNLAFDDQRNLYYLTTFTKNGTRRTKTFRTYEEALVACYPGLTASPPPNYRPAAEPKSGCTLAEWMNWWLTEDVAGNRAASTTYGYRNMARCHILPALGSASLSSLTPLRLQAYLYDKFGEGLSPNTVNKHYTLLYTALQRAIDMNLLDKNPMERVSPLQKNEVHHAFYSPEQLRILFQVTAGTMLGLTVKLAAYLGLRRSEIAGLRWQCVDLKANIILIQEVRTEVGGQEVVKRPKTRRSIRRLGISGIPDLQAELEHAWQQRRSDRPEEYVVLRPDGTPPSPDQLTAQMAQVINQYQLPKITLHGLRHSFASIANSQNIPMHDISRTLGHSSISVTSNIYTHLFDETESETLRCVAKAICG